MDDLHGVTSGPADFGDCGDLFQLFDVRRGQRHRTTVPGPHPADRREAGQNRDDIGAEGGDLGLDGGFRALSDADHRDHGPHSDDDAKHRQRRAHAVPAQHTERHQHRHQQKVHDRAYSGTTRAMATPPPSRSERLTPSLIMMVRRAYPAMSASWESRTTVTS